MSKPLLLTVGNIYVDHNIYGVNGNNDFVLEAGKEYDAASGERVLGGSAINVAMQAQRLNLEVGFVGKTGDDAGSDEVRALLDEEGLISDLVRKDPSKTSSMSVAIVSKGGEFVALHYGNASQSMSVQDIDIDCDLFKRASAVYFGGTAKQKALFPVAEQVFEPLSRRGTKIFYDPNRFPIDTDGHSRDVMQKQLTYVEGYFPNETELLQAMGEDAVDKALGHAINSGVGFVALKLGARGCRVKTHDEDITVDGFTVTPHTTVGAGDCFNATFIAYYLIGKPLKECAEMATAAAAIKVSQNIWPDERAIRKLTAH